MTELHDLIDIDGSISEVVGVCGDQIAIRVSEGKGESSFKNLDLNVLKFSPKLGQGEFVHWLPTNISYETLPYRLGDEFYSVAIHSHLRISGYKSDALGKIDNRKIICTSGVLNGSLTGLNCYRLEELKVNHHLNTANEGKVLYDKKLPYVLSDINLREFNDRHKVYEEGEGHSIVVVKPDGQVRTRNIFWKNPPEIIPDIIGSTSDLTSAAWRVAAHQTIRFIRFIILKLIKEEGSFTKKTEMKVMEKLLSSKIGEIFLEGIVGQLLTSMPERFNHQSITKLAEEIRIGAVSKAGELMIDSVIQQFLHEDQKENLRFPTECNSIMNSIEGFEEEEEDVLENDKVQMIEQRKV